MIVKSNFSLGIYPGDIIIRTAILKGLDDLRKQPFLLDFVFQGLLHDELTVNYYGPQELENCKNWFLDNEIPVTMGYHADNAKLPHITIWLGDQSEADKILGDIHDQSQEEMDLSAVLSKAPPALVFSAAQYDPTTGQVTIPSNQSTSQVWVGMRLWDTKNNKFYVIQDVLDDQNFVIPAGSKPNLTKAQVVNANDMYVVKLESITHRDSYRIQISTQGDAVKCIIIHQILVFILNRYKQSLLEARGFERSVVSSQGMGGTQDGPDAAQWIFSRSIQLVGYVRQYWPKSISPAVQGVGAMFVFDTGPDSEAPSDPEILAEIEDQGWGTTPSDT